MSTQLYICNGGKDFTSQIAYLVHLDSPSTQPCECNKDQLRKVELNAKTN